MAAKWNPQVVRAEVCGEVHDREFAVKRQCGNIPDVTFSPDYKNHLCALEN